MHSTSSHLQEETLDPERQTQGDTKEGFYFGREVPLDSEEGALPLHGPNQWPNPSTLPRFREVTMAYFEAVQALGFRCVHGLDAPCVHAGAVAMLMLATAILRLAIFNM